MTKHINIMNADVADFNLKITTQYKVEGHWVDSAEPEQSLNTPGQSIDIALWDGKRIIIEENGYSDCHWVKKEGK